MGELNIIWESNKSRRQKSPQKPIELEDRNYEFSSASSLSNEEPDYNFNTFSSLHLIMAVDSSSIYIYIYIYLASMKGNRWQKLNQAYRVILSKLSKGYGNKVSVINLGKNIAKLSLEMLNPLGALLNKLEFLGGGTKFKPGIEMVNKLIKKTPKEMRIIIFFFSDGEDRNPKAEMEEMERLKVGHPWFQFYAIGVEATVSMMIQMVKTVNGKFVKVSNANELSHTLMELLFDTYSEFD